MKIKCYCEVCGFEQEREVVIKTNLKEDVKTNRLWVGDGRCEKCRGALWFKAWVFESMTDKEPEPYIIPLDPRSLSRN